MKSFALPYRTLSFLYSSLQRIFKSAHTVALKLRLTWHDSFSNAYNPDNPRPTLDGEWSCQDQRSHHPINWEVKRFKRPEPRLARSFLRSSIRSIARARTVRLADVHDTCSLFRANVDRSAIPWSLHNRATVALSPRYYFCIPLSSRRDSRAPRDSPGNADRWIMYMRGVDLLLTHPAVLDRIYRVPRGSPRGAKKLPSRSAEQGSFFSDCKNFHMSAVSQNVMLDHRAEPKYIKKERNSKLSFLKNHD